MTTAPPAATGLSSAMCPALAIRVSRAFGGFVCFLALAMVAAYADLAQGADSLTLFALPLLPALLGSHRNDDDNTLAAAERGADSSISRRTHSATWQHFQKPAPDSPAVQFRL